jgi:cell division septum initiation protein DivIVA
MIAVRMRVTGHDQQAVTQALKENASQGREAENRNWTNYAERTAEAVFGPRGDRECARSEQRAEAWARVEGRDLSTNARCSPASAKESHNMTVETSSTTERRQATAARYAPGTPPARRIPPEKMSPRSHRLAAIRRSSRFQWCYI